MKNTLTPRHLISTIFYDFDFLFLCESFNQIERMSNTSKLYTGCSMKNLGNASTGSNFIKCFD